MATALLTTYLAPYRVPLFERLAKTLDVEVLCFGGGERYVPPWFTDLDTQLANAPFPARRLSGASEAFMTPARYDAVIAPFAGGAILPAAYAGARRAGKPFVLWASVWREPRSPAHLLARPATRHIYRQADAVIAYGAHVKRFVAQIRGHEDDVFVAPQAVEANLFGRSFTRDQIARFRAEHELPDGPLLLYAGRLVPEKGVAELLKAWRATSADATLLLVGDGPLRERAVRTGRTRVIGPLPREQLPVAYAAAVAAVLPSIPTPRFVEPWGLVCNEAMHQGRPVIATDAVGAVAGGLVRNGETGLVVPAGNESALSDAIGRLLQDRPLRARLGAAARQVVASYNYNAMARAFGHALHAAERNHRG